MQPNSVHSLFRLFLPTTSGVNHTHKSATPQLKAGSGLKEVLARAYPKKLILDSKHVSISGKCKGEHQGLVQN